MLHHLLFRFCLERAQGLLKLVVGDSRFLFLAQDIFYVKLFGQSKMRAV